MTSPAITLKALTDAAADAVARSIATIQREAIRERELREADYRARVAELELRLASVADLERRLSERMGAIKDGEPGRDGLDGENGRDGESGRDGKDGVNGQDGVNGVDGKDGADGLAGRDGLDGINGKDGLDGASGRDGLDGKDGLNGTDGKDGKLPIVKAWSDGVHYAGDVVAHNGGTWQALSDTGHEPPHADWQCLARGGQDGRSPRVRATYDADGEYAELDIIVLNGAAFVARKDDPGPCPGDGWQMIAAQGKQGKPGVRGDKGDRGDPGPGVAGMAADGEGLLTLTNADGSTVKGDLYPLLAKIGR